MKKFWHSNAPVYLGFVLVLLLGTALVWSFQSFPPARAHLELWRILAMALTVMVLRAIWSHRN